MESDKYISIADSGPDGDGTFTVIDMENNFKAIKKPTKAEGILMHPR